MKRIFGGKRTRRALTDLPFTLNCLLIVLGVFIMMAMSIVLIVFEEFTAFTDYTQQWIEFNFFIHYWDKLTIARVYLSFLLIYGGVLVGIGSMQLHGIRKRNLSFLHLAPLTLLFVAVVTVLGAICWLIVTAVNYNEGFLATGGFIFERMRFKGNVWKDLIYREQSFRLVTEDKVPPKSPILKIWVHQRERDFSCCGWDSYLDYAKGNYTNLPESCCQRGNRVYGCGDNFQTIDLTDILNTRGCREVMYSWYRAGFIENIIMSIIGLLIGAFEFYLYSINRKEYYQLLDDLDDLHKPMMNTTMSMSTINSKLSAANMGNFNGGPHGVGNSHLVNFGPQPSLRYPYPHQPQRLMNPTTPSMGGESTTNLIGAGGSGGQLPQLNNMNLNITANNDNSESEYNNYTNPLQAVQTANTRFTNPMSRFRSPQQQQQSSDRVDFN